MGYRNFNQVVVEQDKETGKMITRHPSESEKQKVIDHNLEIGLESSSKIDDFRRSSLPKKVFKIVVELVLLVVHLVKNILKNTVGIVTSCPIALTAGCTKCPVFKICPAKEIVGNYNK